MSDNRQHIFISYAHEDRRWKEEFVSMLAPAQERGILSVWSDGDIAAGENWSAKIHRALAGARVGLLLVTDDFLNSSFITNVELAAFLASARKGGISIRWVPISASLYQYTGLAEIQAAWDPDRPLATLAVPERKAAIQKICLEIVEHFDTPVSVSQGRRQSFRAQIDAKVRDKYTITEEIATGKFSIVYRAERKYPKRVVVIKALAVSEIDDWVRRAFVSGAEHSRDLSSPAFIKVLDSFMEDSPECLISEFIQGERLSNMLWNYPNGLPLARVKAILVELAVAIEEANRQGWRRGELCLSDILIDASGMPRISPLDFSNVLREETQVTGHFLVDRESLSYMTPERFYGTSPSLLSDQYSLGLIATELLGGLHLPPVVHPSDLLDKPQLFADLEGGKGTWSERSPEFTGVVSRMLQQAPDERWPSIVDVRKFLMDIDTEPLERQRKMATASYLRLQANRQRLRKFFADFYGHFFAIAQDVESHFHGIEMERQYTLLNQAMHTLLEFRRESEAACEQLQQLVSGHAKYGLTQRHYALFFEAFVKTIGSPDWRDLGEATAWSDALQPAIDYIDECVKTKPVAGAGAEQVTTCPATPEVMVKVQ